MATYTYSISNVSQTTANIATDKVRIAATGGVAVVPGANAIATANLTGCEVIPNNTVERSFYVGAGNVLAFIGTGAATGNISITELGAPYDLSRSGGANVIIETVSKASPAVLTTTNVTFQNQISNGRQLTIGGATGLSVNINGKFTAGNVSWNAGITTFEITVDTSGATGNYVANSGLVSVL
jgi:hypothetical protein